MMILDIIKMLIVAMEMYNTVKAVQEINITLKMIQKPEKEELENDYIKEIVSINHYCTF